MNELLSSSGLLPSELASSMSLVDASYTASHNHFHRLDIFPPISNSISTKSDDLKWFRKVGRSFLHSADLPLDEYSSG